MPSVESLAQTLAAAFNPQQADLLARVIHDSYSELVKTSDFDELKGIVRELAASQERLALAQERTETRLEQLVAAQERTEAHLEQLAAAQERTEARLEQLAAAQQRTEVSVRQLAREVGGLARSMAYSLENEAYRALPAYLLRKHNIRIETSIVRTQLDGKEINVFARGTRDGQPVVIIGEAKLQLDERRGNRREEDAVLAQLFEPVEVARHEYPGVEIVPVLVTHYARPTFLKRAREAGVIVIQSFEW